MRLKGKIKKWNECLAVINFSFLKPKLRVLKLSKHVEIYNFEKEENSKTDMIEFDSSFEKLETLGLFEFNPLESGLNIDGIPKLRFLDIKLWDKKVEIYNLYKLKRLGIKCKEMTIKNIGYSLEDFVINMGKVKYTDYEFPVLKRFLQTSNVRKGKRIPANMFDITKLPEKGRTLVEVELTINYDF